MARSRPIRVLHNVAAMDRGGIENWLLGVFRRTDPRSVRHELLLHSEGPDDHEPELRELGIPIHRGLDPTRPLRYARRLRAILRERGPYDVVHGHLFTWSGWLLPQATRAGVAVRVAHSHNAETRVRAAHPILWPAYGEWMRRLIRRHSTHRLACSELAAAGLFGPAFRGDWRLSILHYGVDLSRFDEPVDGALVRRELGLPDDALVIASVARLMQQKNQRFLIELAAALGERIGKAHVLLVGDGPLRDELERLAAERGVADRVHFLGSRDDVPRILLGAVDCVAMPSRFEGLPVAAIEAQAAGVPLLLADHLAEEIAKPGTAVYRLPIGGGVAPWVEAIAERVAGGDAGTAAGTASPLKGTDFDIEHSAAWLNAFYAEAAGG